MGLGPTHLEAVALGRCFLVQLVQEHQAVILLTASPSCTSPYVKACNRLDLVAA